MKNTIVLALFFLLLGCWSAVGQTPARPRSENAMLILVDGLRWQEVFNGADSALMNKENGGVEDGAALKQTYWRDNLEARREVLSPFLWRVVAKQGQLFGNQDKKSIVRVTNGYHFSYPGYSEMIVGYSDTAINSNDKYPNPNVSVFEWLHQRQAFKGKIAAFGAWQVVPWIINRERCGFYVNGGVEPVTVGNISAEQALLNR